MNNRTSFEELLDQWLVQQISLEEMATASQKNLNEVKEAAGIHALAIVALEKYAVQETVSKVHGRYLAARKEQKPLPARIVSMHKNKWFIRVAASAAIFTGLFMAIDSLPVNTDKFYAENFKDYQVNIERGVTISNHVALDEYFREGNYAATIQAFRQHGLTSNKEIFLTGYAYLKVGEFDNAARLFNVILSKGNDKEETLFKDEAEYYLGLTYVKLKEVEKAYQLFSKIKEDRTHTFYDNIDNWSLTRMRWFK